MAHQQKQNLNPNQSKTRRRGNNRNGGQQQQRRQGNQRGRGVQRNRGRGRGRGRGGGGGGHKVCRFHIKGTCKYGINCRFSHNATERNGGKKPQLPQAQAQEKVFRGDPLRGLQ